jgi:predicted permease
MGYQIGRDLTYAVRSLIKSPRFSAVAAFTLALGIGANTAIFSAVNGVLLQPLEFPESDHLVNVWSHAPGLGYDQFPLSPDVYFFYRSESSVFQDIAISIQREANLSGDGEPERVQATSASHSFFSTLGVSPLLGRTHSEEEDLPDAGHVVVISHELWQRRYGGDRTILGRSIHVNGEPRDVIGVMPERFRFPNDADIWVPLGMDPDSPPIGNFGWYSIARLEPGVTPAQAQGQLVPLVRRIMEQNAELDEYHAFLETGRYAPMVHRMKEDLIGDLEQPLWILLGTVGFVLLIACANVANLFLVRAETRQREMAVRSALGASRLALVRQYLAESAVLASFGGVLGLVLAWSSMPALIRLAPPQLPRLDEVGIDGTVLAFTVAVTALSALLFGTAPVLRYTSVSILGALKHGGRGSTVGRGGHRARNVLVMAQTGLALVLLVGSGLLVQSFWRIRQSDIGFEYEDILTFRLSLPASDYPGAESPARFHQELLDRLAALPGVEAVGAASELPLDEGARGTAFDIEDHPTEVGQLPPMLHYIYTAPGYFETMGMRPVRGRALQRSDYETERGHVVINRTISDRFWSQESPLGRRLRPSGDTANWYAVAGVVESVRQHGIREDPPPLVYYPLVGLDGDEGFSARSLSYVLKAENPTSLGPSVRSTVWSLDPDLPVAVMQTMDDIVSASVTELSFTMLTLGIASLMALILGAVGLYGVLSYVVSQRTQEIGVRMALGADRSKVLRMVVFQGARTALIGLGLGLLGAAALTRLLQGLLFGTDPLDPLSFAGMTFVLFAVGILASYLPARRAAAVNPVESIKLE